jgi:hypothetical protein
VELKNKNSSNIFIKRCFLPISSIKIGDETAFFRADEAKNAVKMT